MNKAAIIDQQGGRCAICHRSLKRYVGGVIEHCHLTDEVRGITCRRCNSGLGFFESIARKEGITDPRSAHRRSREILFAAIAYVDHDVRHGHIREVRRRRRGS